jgi:hypothetical protein
MAKKTRFDIEREEHLKRPPRLKGKVQSAQLKNVKKKKKD